MIIFGFVLVLIPSLISNSSTPAVINVPETWNSGTTEGWTGYDVLNCNSRPVSNPGSYLQIAFGQQSMSFPAVYLMMADSMSSGGRFVGNYWEGGVSSIAFKFYCQTHVPAQARLYFYNVTSGNRWYFSLENLQAGQWTEFDIPLNYAAGWKLDLSSTLEKFESDITNGIGWVGIRIQRSSSTDIQNYGLDDFELKRYGSEDSDGDGFSDYLEWLAGTNPNDPSSLFNADIGAGAPSGSIIISWPSKSGNIYEVWRSTNLLETSSGFKLYKGGITGKPPVNVYIDTNTADLTTVFYRIKIQ